MNQITGNLPWILFPLGFLSKVDNPTKKEWPETLQCAVVCLSIQPYLHL